MASKISNSSGKVSAVTKQPTIVVTKEVIAVTPQIASDVQTHGAEVPVEPISSIAMSGMTAQNFINGLNKTING